MLSMTSSDRFIPDSARVATTICFTCKLEAKLSKTPETHSIFKECSREKLRLSFSSQQCKAWK